MDTRPNVAGAVETIASHLHPTPSYDLADHPVPSGREEVWRFTPLRRLRGLLEAEATGARLSWELARPEGVAYAEISAAEARALGGRAPGDRIAALAAEHSGEAVLFDVPANLELAEPVVLDLSGDAADALVHGHLVFRIGHHAKVTIAIRHRGSATYAALTQVLIGDGADVTFVSVAD
ncbi:MAG: Fe-S cluster assembly protein SufD, partial [Propionibacteriaceae bacterium]|nr:Fe-S cluster assembly protein SufD [Propionibacteriaceae bacterium]